MAHEPESQLSTASAALEQLQKSPSLKLISIAETLAPKDSTQFADKRTSTVSEDSEQSGDTHPAALQADLLHYKVHGPAPTYPTGGLMRSGAVRQTPLQLCRASYEGEVPTRHNCRSTESGRGYRERGKGERYSGFESDFEGAQGGNCRTTAAT
jgi:hypothetical protein